MGETGMEEIPKQMSEAMDELENLMDNVMTDDEVDKAHHLINKLRRQYEDDKPTDIPALDCTDSATEMVVEEALMEGYVVGTHQTLKDHEYEVTVTIAIPEHSIARRSDHYNKL